MASRMAVDVEGAIKACVERLGFRDIKKEQKEAIMKFVVEGQDVSCAYQQDFASHYAVTAYQSSVTYWQRETLLGR